MLRKVFLPLAIVFSLIFATVTTTLAGSTPTNCYPPLSLVTNSIPPATAGSGYSVSLAANGGQPPYTWSFGQSSLPQGFSIDSSGNVTGTPSKAGRYSFNVVVSDALKNNVTGQLTLLVTANSGSTTLTATPPPTRPCLTNFPSFGSLQPLRPLREIFYGLNQD